MTSLLDGKIRIELTGNAGDYTAILKSLTAALVLLPEQADREQIGNLLTAMLPEEKQIK